MEYGVCQVAIRFSKVMVPTNYNSNRENIRELGVPLLEIKLSKNKLFCFYETQRKFLLKSS